MRITAASGLALAATFVGALAPVALAAPVAEVVPYSGFLDRDGVPADGAVALRFRVYNDNALPAAPDGDACNGGPAGCLWAEVHEGVLVHAGAFSVRLGGAAGDARRPIAPLLRGREQLYLEVGVRNEADGRWAVLGRQAITPVPQALFTLQPDIEVGSLNVTGGAQAETLRVRKVGNPGFLVHDPAVVVGDPGAANLGLSGAGVSARQAGGPGTLYLNPGSRTDASELHADTVAAGQIDVSTIRFPSGATMRNLTSTTQSLQGGCCAAIIRPARNSVCMLGGYGARDMGDDVGQSCAVGIENNEWKAYFSSYDAARWVSCQITCLVWE